MDTDLLLQEPSEQRRMPGPAAVKEQAAADVRALLRPGVSLFLRVTCV